jgi:hypothetical protein
MKNFFVRMTATLFILIVFAVLIPLHLLIITLCFVPCVINELLLYTARKIWFCCFAPRLIIAEIDGLPIPKTEEALYKHFFVVTGIKKMQESLEKIICQKS